MNAFEQARAERIAANQAKMRDLGLADAVHQLQATAGVDRPAKARAAPQKRKMYEIEVEVRRSGRLHGEQPLYNEESLADKALGIERLDLISCQRRRRRVGVDPTQLAAIRERRIKEVDGEGAEPRGPFDSGRGVRIQGGRVYDSKYGVTCHWCRQKTLEEHVTCSNSECGGGRSLAVSFCKRCLLNRHGEEIGQAEASENWVCPRCRGSCGEGCTVCCNCGPCRKAAGLAPTHHIINQARAAGFENVHDFLVHQKTGQSAEEIAERKRQAAWGAWLDVPFEPQAAAAEEEEEAVVEQAVPAQAATADHCRNSGRSAVAVPEGAGGALLLYSALRWHLLAARFCAVAKVLASAPRPNRRHPASPAAPASAVEPAAVRTILSSAAQEAAAAPRRSARRSQQAAALPSKVTAFFQPTAPSPAPVAAANKAQPAQGKAAVAVVPPNRANRLGMRSRK